MAEESCITIPWYHSNHCMVDWYMSSAKLYMIQTSPSNSPPPHLPHKNLFSQSSNLQNLLDPSMVIIIVWSMPQTRKEGKEKYCIFTTWLIWPCSSTRTPALGGGYYIYNFGSWPYLGHHNICTKLSIWLIYAGEGGGVRFLKK